MHLLRINVTAQTLLAAAYSFAVQGTIQVTPGAGTVLASMAGLSDMFGNAINPALLVNNVSVSMTVPVEGQCMCVSEPWAVYVCMCVYKPCQTPCRLYRPSSSVQDTL